MPTKIINWGIIGAGKIANKFATDLATVNNAKLYGIASRSQEKANAFALKHRAATSYDSYEALTTDPNIDAIYVATPHSFHKAHTLLALNNKVPVLCEKPFALNLQEVDEMIKCAITNDTLLMEAMWTLFLPHYQYVLKILKQKHFGDLQEVQADFGFVPKYDENSRLFNTKLGGGSLLDIGIYPVFAALSVLGKPKSITAKASFFNTGADAECDINFTFNKAKAVLKSTFLKETKTEAKFKCEHGSITIQGRFHEPSSVILTADNGTRQIKTFKNKTLGYNHEIEHFNHLIRTYKTESNLMSFEKSRQLISTLDTIRAQIGLGFN